MPCDAALDDGGGNDLETVEFGVLPRLKVGTLPCIDADVFVEEPIEVLKVAVGVGGAAGFGVVDEELDGVHGLMVSAELLNAMLTMEQ